MKINGTTHTVEGALLAVIADTPAAHWLVGFKEGVGFSHKNCRNCDAAAVSISNSFVAESFNNSNWYR